MDTQITPDLGRGGYRSSGRPESSSDSDSSHSIASSAGTLDLLDDPVPGANTPREEAMDTEDLALRLLLTPQDPEDIQPIGVETPFTTEEHQATQACVNTAQLYPRGQERAITNIIRLDRNRKLTKEALGDAQTADDKMQVHARYREATKLTLFSQTAA